MLQRAVPTSILTVFIIANAMLAWPQNSAFAVSASSDLDEQKNYSRPLLFSPEDNKINLMAPQIKWDFDQNKINLGGVVLDGAAINVTLDQIPRETTPRKFREYLRSTPLVTNLSFAWPEILTKDGRLEIYSQTGQLLFSQRVDSEKRASFKRFFRAPEKKLLDEHSKSNFGILDVDLLKMPFLAGNSVFRACISEIHSPVEKIRICTGFNRVIATDGKLSLQPEPSSATPTVFIGNSEIGPSGAVNFQKENAIQVRVRFSSGAIVDFSSRPLTLKLLDVVASNDESRIILKGQGEKPLGNVRTLQVPPNHFWSATGTREEPIWQVIVTRDNPTVRVQGAWNIPFTYLVRFDRVPKEADRVFLNTHAGSGTYSSNPELFLSTPAKTSLISHEASVTPRGENRYAWTFNAPQKGERNKARVLVQNTDNPDESWVAHYQLFRGYPWELSARLTGIVDSTLQLNLIAEGAAAYWFETLGRWQSSTFSKHRWGLSTRYFRSLSDFSVSEDTPSQPFRVLNFDVKYNITPGIWNRDELFGLTWCNQVISLGGFHANLSGVGAYWARTMPKVFDDLFNIFWFFRYPKYVDMEFLYFPLSLTSDTTAGATYNLNFHGKVFWSKTLYGEAGFGIKQFDFIDVPTQNQITIGTAYGTVGLGFIF